MNVFNLPDLGEGLTEAEIVEWHVKAGDEIKADASLVSVETDKAIVEIPSPHSGRVEKLFADVGDIVQTGKPLVAFEGEGKPVREDSGTVVGKVVRGDEKLEEKAAAVGRKAGPAVKATPSVRAMAKQ